MGRLVLFYLLQFVRRVAQRLTAGPRDDAYTTYLDDEREQGTSKTAIALIAGLAFYIVVGLGYYAKVHCWDELTEAQKDVVVQAMIANEKAL